MESNNEEIYDRNGVKFKHIGNGYYRVLRTEEEKNKAYEITPEFLGAFLKSMVGAGKENTLEKRASESQA